MAEDADGQMKLDFGRTADRIYINAKTSVTLIGNAGGGRGKTGLYLLPTYTIIGNIIGRSEKAGGNGKGIDDTGICPVSYTHLDVYKRQPLHRLRTISGCMTTWKRA